MFVFGNVVFALVVDFTRVSRLKGVVDRVGCLSLLLMTQLSIESHVEPSSAAVSQVVSFVKSLLSRLGLVGCK